MPSEDGPQVIVSEKNLALMNVIAPAFPKCYNLLCRFHIQKNVQSKCKMFANFVDTWDVVMDAWENVMYFEDESTFTDCVERLRHVCISWPLFL